MKRKLRRIKMFLSHRHYPRITFVRNVNKNGQRLSTNCQRFREFPELASVDSFPRNWVICIKWKNREKSNKEGYRIVSNFDLMTQYWKAARWRVLMIDRGQLNKPKKTDNKITGCKSICLTKPGENLKVDRAGRVNKHWVRAKTIRICMGKNCLL